VKDESELVDDDSWYRRTVDERWSDVISKFPPEAFMVDESTLQKLREFPSCPAIHQP